MKKTATSKGCYEVCPIANAAALVGDLWVILIVRDLLKGPRRFGELSKSIVDGESGKAVNTRTLTLRLKLLIENGLVERKEFPGEMPPKVLYSLSKKGHALSGIIDRLGAFGRKYL